jgi:hypothetical protein
VRMIFRSLIDEQPSTYQINKRLNESNPSIETKQKVLLLVVERIQTRYFRLRCAIAT